MASFESSSRVCGKYNALALYMCYYFEGRNSSRNECHQSGSEWDKSAVERRTEKKKEFTMTAIASVESAIPVTDPPLLELDPDYDS